jgi:hypothetical protein
LTINADVREHIIKMAQEGIGRNRISYELAKLNIKASKGSVSNILADWRSKNKEQSTVIDINLHDKSQQLQIVNTQLQPSSENSTMQTAVYTPKTEENEDSLNSPDIDFCEVPYKDSYPYLSNNHDVQSIDVTQEVKKEEGGENGQLESITLSNVEDPLLGQLTDLEVKKASLLKQIEDSQRIMEDNKKAADDFLIVKEEMVKCGIEADSADFIKVIRIFRKFGHDPSKIMNTFLEIQDVAMEKERIKSLKEETDHKLSVLRRKLEEIGLGDFQKLKQIVVSLMTLETYGIGIEQIISYYHSIRAQNNRKPQYIGGRIA